MFSFRNREERIQIRDWVFFFFVLSHNRILICLAYLVWILSLLYSYRETRDLGLHIFYVILMLFASVVIVLNLVIP